MIEVKGLKHTYATKSKDNVLALKGVTFSIGDSGMYFIEGKSGCGKSTLLNLLGGLAKIQEGDILFNGVSLKDFSAVEYDTYRASEVGIIFQEFNLIDNLTVGENIELQLNIARANADKGKIAESLKRVDLEGYEKRMPNELSGGEKQRVAIARQLAKGAKVILADEPTGNLDEENGENVFEILKKLSKDIAIVVVSHDMDFADRYSDYIIKMRDGKIISFDEKTNYSNACKNSRKSAYKAVKPHFPQKYIFKLAFKNLFKKKIRLGVALFLSMICFGLFCITGSVINYDSQKTIAGYYEQNPNNYYTIAQGNLTQENTLYISDMYNCSKSFVEYFDGRSEIDKIKIIGHKEGYGRVPTLLNDYSQKGYAIVEDAKQLEKITGFKMLGEYLPLDEKSVYITDYFANAFIENEFEYLDDGFIKKLDSSFELTDLVGLVVVKDDYEFTIAGILQTDYERYDYLKVNKKIEDTQGTPNTEDNENMPNVSEEENETKRKNEEKRRQQQEDFYCLLYMNTDCARSMYARNGRLNFNYGDTMKLNGQKTTTPSSFAQKCINFNDTATFVLTGDKIYNGESNGFVIDKGDVYFNLKSYNQAFGETDTTEDYLTKISLGNYEPTGKYPKHIGEKVSFEAIKYGGEVLCSDTYTFKGLVLTNNEIDLRSSQMYMYGESLVDLYLILGSSVKSYMVSGGYFEANMYEELSDYRKYAVGVKSEFAQSIYANENFFLQVNYTFRLLSIAFLIISLLMFMNYISTTITDRSKEIGIIRALGGTSGSVFKIFFTLSCIFWLISNILALLFYLIILPMYNSILVGDSVIVVGAKYLFVNPLIILVVLAISFIATSMASFVPILLASRKPPIEVITDK